MRIVVIGSGFGGLAVAIRLQARGHHVTLVEKQETLGGRASVYKREGFIFDGGPTVITAPWMIHELFELAGRNSEDYVRLVPLNPFYRIFLSDRDQTQFDYSGNTTDMLTQIQTLNPDDIIGYQKFLHHAENIFRKGFVELADQPFLHPWDMIKILPDMIRLQSYRSVYGLVSHYVQDERLRQILSFHSLLVGGNPFKTTSIYTLIHYLERHGGVWFALGGTGALVAALGKLFSELGGHVVLNSEVGRILLDRGRTVGIQLVNGREIVADAVVSNADVAHTYRSLLPQQARKMLLTRRLRSMSYGMSLVVIYFGTDRLYRQQGLVHHNIILGPRYQPLLHDIFTRKVLAEDFSLYLHMPTFTDSSLAPSGCESFYVLSPVPNLSANIDWNRQARPYRDKIMAMLEERFLPDLSRHIVVEHMIDPRHFRDVLNSAHGNAFSIEPLLRQSAYFRPHNRDSSIANLYFVGAGTHPGAGIPGVLSSAKIVEQLICSSPLNERTFHRSATPMYSNREN